MSLVTESGTLKAEYLVTVDKNKQIDKVEYLGLLFDGTKPVESALARQLTGDASKSGEKASGAVGGSSSGDKRSSSTSSSAPAGDDRPVEGNVPSS